MVGLPAFLQSLAKYGLSQATCSAPIPPLKSVECGAQQSSYEVIMTKL